MVLDEFIYLEDNATKKEAEIVSFSSLLSKGLHQQGLGQAEAEDQKGLLDLSWSRPATGSFSGMFPGFLAGNCIRSKTAGSRNDTLSPCITMATLGYLFYSHLNPIIFDFRNYDIENKQTYPF